MGDRHSTKGIVAQDTSRFAGFAQDENGVCLPADVLTGLGFEVAIQALHAAGKAAAIVPLVEQHAPKIVGWSLRHSRHDPAQPFAGWWGIGQGIEEDGSIPVRQNERFIFFDCPGRGFMHAGNDEVG